MMNVDDNTTSVFHDDEEEDLSSVVDPNNNDTDWEEWEALQHEQHDNNNSTYTWENLQLIETKRREILQRVDQPFWRILQYWEGTCLRVLSRDMLVWGCLVLYTIIRIQAHRGNLPSSIAVALGDANLDVVGGFLSFFLVLFCNQCNERFHVQYHASMACQRHLIDLATLMAYIKLCPIRTCPTDTTIYECSSCGWICRIVGWHIYTTQFIRGIKPNTQVLNATRITTY